MDRSLYIAASGAAHNTLGLNAHANNLANVSSTGFKRDFNQTRAMPIFGQIMASRAYALSERPATDFAQGAINQTGNNLDIAVNGGAFLAVQKEDGSEAYLSSASLHINAAGDLLANNLPVLGLGGAINLPQGANISIGNNGSISVDNARNVAHLKLVKADAAQIYKEQDGLIHARQELAADENISLTTGALELSNVNAVSEMTNILELTKHFELNLKVMHKIDQSSEANAKILQLA